MSEVLTRDDIEEEYKWSLESIYPDDEAWESDFEAVEGLIDEMGSFEGRVSESGDTLLDILQTRERLYRKLSMVVSFARMRWDEDTRRERYQALTSRSKRLSARAQSAASFVEPELQQLDPEILEDWLDTIDGLATYEHYLDDVMRQRPHTRSAEVEQLLADLSDVLGASGDIYSMFHNADLKFPTVEDTDGEPVEITQSNFTTLLKDPDRSFRHDVYDAYFDRWGEFRNTVATAFRHNLERERTLSQARDFDSARQMNLFGPNVPTVVYDRLVETVEGNLEVLHRHVELKRDVLGVDDLQMWDIYAPLASDDDPTVEYQDATHHVIDSLGLLGEDYQSRVATGIESRWVDVYENRGKRGGAYSGGTYDTQPFILMNYQDDISSMYTLAHELGHSLHSEFTSEEQPYVYSHYSIFIAEVASTVNEVLLTHHLLETVDDPTFQRHILDQALERYRGVLYRQTLFADFEQQAHRLAAEGEAITADQLDEVFFDLKSTYYEPAVLDDHIAMEWMRIPHFYRPFYVFQYSTGISAAVAIAKDIIERGEPAAQNYIEFLGLGSSQYPLDLLETAGVDMTTSAPIESAIDVYRERLDQFETAIEAESSR